MAATEGLKDVEVSSMLVLYYLPRDMSLLLDTVLRSLVVVGPLWGCRVVFGGLVSYMGTRTDGDEPTGTNRVKL